jgi:hypothetical protein
MNIAPLQTDMDFLGLLSNVDHNNYCDLHVQYH